MARVNILRQIRTEKGWRNAALPRKKDGRINWPSRGRYLSLPRHSRLSRRIPVVAPGNGY